MKARLLQYANFTLGALLLTACHGRATLSTPRGNNAPPALVLGDFQDDYDGRFSISATDFFQRPRAHFHIVQWHVRDQYFIAQNDSLNSSAANKWTRIDWLPLAGMMPYEWAFCFSSYDAPTRAAAESATAADRAKPQTGCNKFPFSRMRRMSP